MRRGEQICMIIKWGPTRSAGNWVSLSFPLKTPVLVRIENQGHPACEQTVEVGYTD